MHYTTTVKTKMFAGLLLALALGSCPTLTAFAAAVSPRGGHACCPSDESAKRGPQPAPVSGDCCLRAPAHGPAFVVAPELRVVFVVLTSVPALSQTRRISALDSSGASPPPDEIVVRGSSPRAPPAVLA